MKTINVEITECKIDGEVMTSNHRTGNPMEAMKRAIRKHFRKSYSFLINHELSNENVIYFVLTEWVPKCNASSIESGRLAVRMFDAKTGEHIKHDFDNWIEIE